MTGLKSGVKPGAVDVWRKAWPEFIPFLDYPPELRKIVYTTNAIVIWSVLGSVVHVGHGGVRVRNLLGGPGYLPLSIRQIFRRSDVCSAGRLARLAA